MTSAHPPPPVGTDLPTLRTRVDEVLRSASDLDAFCHDHFRDEVYRRFSNGMDRVQKVTLLLEHAPHAALGIVEARHGRDTLESATLLHNIGGILHAQERFAEAEHPARRAWEWRRSPGR